MKQKIFAKIAIALIVFSGVVSPSLSFISATFSTPHAYADTTTTVSPNTDAIDQTTQNSGTITADGAECGTWDFLCSLGKFTSYILLYIPTIVATISGMLFDMSIWHSLQSGTYTKYDGQTGSEGIVVSGWKLVRDFTNLLFIFALFAIAFSLILNVNLGLEPKKTIARVVVMALLVNFSFFLTRALVDISNTLGLSFYNNMTNAPEMNTKLGEYDTNTQSALGNPQSFYKDSGGARSISAAIISKINPQSLVLLSQDNTIDTSWSLSTLVVNIVTSLMVAIFNLFLIYIFISIAILFVARTIGIYIAVILSPIAFVSRTIPQLEKKNYIGFDDWLKQLVGIAFMAPIFLFFLYITIQFLDIGGANPGDGQILARSAQIFFKLLLVGFFLYYAKKIAKDMSGRIGEMAVSTVTSVATTGAMFAGAVATGGAAGALQMGRSIASNTIKSGAISAGNAVLGTEKTEQIQQRWGVLSNFKNNPKAAMSASRKIFGENAVSQSFRTGSVFNRTIDIERSVQAKKKADEVKEAKNKWATREVDQKIKNNKKDFDDGIKTKKEYENTLKALALEKRAILDPTTKETSALNTSQGDLKRAQEEHKDADVENKLTRNQNKIIDLDTKIATNTTALADAATKLADAAKDKNLARKEVVDKKNELTNAQNSDASLQQDFDTVEKELAALPKTGFGVDRNKISDLEKRRSDISTKRSLIAADIQKMSVELNKLEEKEKLALSVEEAAINQKDALEAADKELQRNKATADAEKATLTAEKVRLEAAVSSAEKEVTDATTGLSRKKEEVSLTNELESRTRVEKTDTDNRARNDKRVDEIRNRLRTISTGGITPSGGTPPTGGTGAPSGSSGATGSGGIPTP